MPSTSFNVDTNTIERLLKSADRLDEQARTVSNPTKDDLRTQAATLRNQAQTLINAAIITLVSDPAAAVEEAKLKAQIKKTREVLARIKKARDSLALATKLVGAIASLFTGKVTTIVEGFKALNDATKKYEELYPPGPALAPAAVVGG